MTLSSSGMPGRNQVMLTGWVVKSPQFHHQLNGTPVLQFFLKVDDPEETTRRSPDRGSKDRPCQPEVMPPSSIQIVAFGPLAQEGALLRDGQRLCVKGRLTERRWKLADGRIRSRVEVIASELLVVEEPRTPV
ncbi:MAG: single-stranded DNA-binding protein [Desulfobacterota bacterium]|nr:single-stranded DNA-binding protein [Thermodesulfobacteriota bacterium]